MNIKGEKKCKGSRRDQLEESTLKYCIFLSRWNFHEGFELQIGLVVATSYLFDH